MPRVDMIFLKVRLIGLATEQWEVAACRHRPQVLAIIVLRPVICPNNVIELITILREEGMAPEQKNQQSCQLEDSLS